MADAFYNQTNVKGASERNVIPAMVQSKVHKILSTAAAWYLKNKGPERVDTT